MGESFRTRADKMHNCLSQLRSIQATLEYWKARQRDDTNEWLLAKANEFIEMAAKRIDVDELMVLASER